MGLCEYCGKKPADLEIVDDRQDSGMAMVCSQCHPDRNGKLFFIPIIDAVRILLARIQDEKGIGFWHRKPLTDLEKAAQDLAKLVPPEQEYRKVSKNVQM